MEAEPFIILGTYHTITLLFIASLAIAFPLHYKKKSSNKRERTAYFLGLAILTLEFFKPFIWHHFFDYAWILVIPIHMCNLSAILIGIFLLTGNKLLYEVAFFWGLGGGIMALVTPTVAYTFPDSEYMMFFFGHGLLIVVIGYASIALGNRPTMSSVKNGIGVSLITLPTIYLINFILGSPANYWYLGARPEGENIMNFLPDPPNHIPLTIIIGIFFFCLIYLPFWMYDKFKKDAQ